VRDLVARFIGDRLPLGAEDLVVPPAHRSADPAFGLDPRARCRPPPETGAETAPGLRNHRRLPLPGHNVIFDAQAWSAAVWRARGALSLPAAGRYQPFESVDDLWRRANVPVASLVQLAEADAINESLGLTRRESLSALKALRDEPLVLFVALAQREARTGGRRCRSEF
jgi:hypothetical protein